MGERHCPGAYVVADRLEEIVLDSIRDYAKGGLPRSPSVGTVVADLAKDSPGAEEECARWRAELAQLADRFTEWAERLDDGLIDEEQFRNRNEALLRRKRDLQQQLEAAEAKAANREAVEAGLAEVKQMLTDSDRVWEEMGLEEQRGMLQSLVQELMVGRGVGELKLLFLPAIELKWPTRGGTGASAQGTGADAEAWRRRTRRGSGSVLHYPVGGRACLPPLADALGVTTASCSPSAAKSNGLVASYYGPRLHKVDMAAV